VNRLGKTVAVDDEVHAELMRWKKEGGWRNANEVLRKLMLEGK
jgi:predicted CopG family antitoxin